jgi:hypothetical protein
MPLRVKWNPRALEVNLEQIGERARKGMAAKMRVVAIKIRDLARDYAPVDTGLLERSIDYTTTRGVNGRHVFTVYIDLDAPRTNGKGQLGDYADEMEKQLRPHGRVGKPFFLGPGSVAKAATGKKVGGRFLGRAVEEGTKELFGEMLAEVRRVTGKRTVNVQYERTQGGEE